MFIILPFLLHSQIFTGVVEGKIVNDKDNSFCCAWVDFDNAEDLDVSISNYGSDNCLYKQCRRNIREITN